MSLLNIGEYSASLFSLGLLGDVLQKYALFASSFSNQRYCKHHSKAFFQLENA
jgi:hypothetical protein